MPSTLSGTATDNGRPTLMMKKLQDRRSAKLAAEQMQAYYVWRPRPGR